MAYILKSRHGGYVARGPRRAGQGCLMVQHKAEARARLTFPDPDAARAWIRGVQMAQESHGMRKPERVSAFPVEA